MASTEKVDRPDLQLGIASPHSPLLTLRPRKRTRLHKILQIAPRKRPFHNPNL